MQFSNRAQGFRNDKSQEISSTTAKSYQPVTQGVVGDKSSSINNIRDPEKKVDIVEEFPSWAGKPKDFFLKSEYIPKKILFSKLVRGQI